MSMLTINTNQPRSELPDTLHGVLTSLIQKELEVERQSVYIRVFSGENMTLGGSHAPCIYATLGSPAHLEAERREKVIAHVHNVLSESLHVQHNRTVVRFDPIPTSCTSRISQ